MFDKIIHRWLRIPYSLNVRQIKKVKKPRAQVLFIHGIGASGEGWETVIDQLPDDISVMTIDLLGFGQSPRPDWAKYDVATQAKSIITTLIKLRLTRKLVIVGHSLGSLVAIEVAKRYPIIVESLVLCSPPIYDADNDKNIVLKQVFKTALKRPEDFINLAKIATKYKLINPSFNVTEDNFHSYMATLRASILTQTSLKDVVSIDLPIELIAGTADPWIKKRNLKFIAENNPLAKLTTVLAGHEIKGRYSKVVAQTIAGDTPSKR